MRYEDIEFHMYQGSRQCMARGSKKVIVCILPWVYEGKAYCVGILRRSLLVGSGRARYSYIIMSDGKVLPEDGKEYAELSSALPALDSFRIAYGGKFAENHDRELCTRKMIEDFSEENRLDDWGKKTFEFFIRDMPQGSREFFHIFYRSCIGSNRGK